ncbi:hypothetical protein [uncultured Friedmanniella sp.]|uniref:hypothetical protein n=1 Tax=uncultured Friedmanniella sp. TaxID=335381 RepID=UPI0035CA6EEA
MPLTLIRAGRVEYRLRDQGSAGHETTPEVDDRLDDLRLVKQPVEAAPPAR